MRVLIADDDMLTRRILLRLLDKWGYTTIAAGEGKTAWEILNSSEKPDLAILDWDMPGKSGPEICKDLRKTDPSGITYLILLTVKNLREDIISGMEAGADDYIVKPFDFEEFRVRVQAGERIIRLQKAVTENEKMQSLLELAGAICHELNQPFQVISGYAEVSLLSLSKDNPLYENIQVIKEQVDKMGKITKKLMKITKYETLEYLPGKRILDIDKSSDSNE